MSRLVLFLLATLMVLAATGCARDFDGYVAQPTMCDPVHPSASAPRDYVTCLDSQTCVFANATGDAFDANHTTCVDAPAEPTSLGDSCKYENDCSAGQACTDLGCVEQCWAGDSCADGSACIAFEPALRVNGKAVGYCALPRLAALAQTRERVACIGLLNVHAHARDSDLDRAAPRRRRAKTDT
jgi:hypothetical protein